MKITQRELKQIIREELSRAERTVQEMRSLDFRRTATGALRHGSPEFDAPERGAAMTDDEEEFLTFMDDADIQSAVADPKEAAYDMKPIMTDFAHSGGVVSTWREAEAWAEDTYDRMVKLGFFKRELEKRQKPKHGRAYKRF